MVAGDSVVVVVVVVVGLVVVVDGVVEVVDASVVVDVVDDEADGTHQSVGTVGTGGSHGLFVVVEVVVEGCGHHVLDVVGSVVPGFQDPSSGVGGDLVVVDVVLLEPSSSSGDGVGGGVGKSGRLWDANTLFTVLIRGYVLP